VTTFDAEIVLVGGGLANSLIALRLLRSSPDARILVIEREDSLGGNHTWSFHDSDLTTDQQAWIAPMVAHAWSRHELRFPGRRRVLHDGYNSVTSDQLHRVVGRALGDRMLLGVDAEEVSSDGVRLTDGRLIGAQAVIDGRGDPGRSHLDVGFQKFLGLFVRLVGGHGLDGPILMDATVEQRDGYRFVYTLPLSSNELLIEDTYYADGPALDLEALRRGIGEYAATQGWEIAEITGEETGVLPIVLGGDIEGLWNDGPPGVARSGMRGAFFHPTTGYSLPEAVRLADEIATLPSLDGPTLTDLTRRRSEELWRRTGFYRLLNRMLFRAAEPELRYRIFERFYGLSGGLIRRFYAGRLKWTDKVRLLTGKPPVPVLPALRCLADRRDPASTSMTDSPGGKT